MGIICKLFGHKSLENDGWCHGVGYAQVGSIVEDGIGQVHLYIKARCPRCREMYSICNIHLPKEANR